MHEGLGDLDFWLRTENGLRTVVEWETGEPCRDNAGGSHPSKTSTDGGSLSCVGAKDGRVPVYSESFSSHAEPGDGADPVLYTLNGWGSP